MTRTLLIDGDVVLYEICIACETAVDWGDDMWTLHADFKEASQRFDCWVADITERLQASAAIIAFSGPSNWRKELLPSYKSNRRGRRKPLLFPTLRSYAKDIHRNFEFENLEADDVLGLLAGGLGNISGEKVIVTIDKDLLTIPGLHFYPNKPEDGIISVSQEQADFNHLMQALAGDAVDGYAGCPGIGPVRAQRLLDEKAEWSQVVLAYEKAGVSEEDALIQAQVARILRYGEYDVTKEQVITWTPSSN